MDAEVTSCADLLKTAKSPYAPLPFYAEVSLTVISNKTSAHKVI